MGKICCFTGHRLHKLPWLADPHHPLSHALREIVRQKILQKINDGYDYFISGMAIGCDMFFAQIVLNLRSEFPNIKLECALPCADQANIWPDTQKQEYLDILSACNYVNILTPRYSRACLHMRNRYMVSKSDALIAVWDGTSGGTKNTVVLAQKYHLDIEIIDPGDCIDAIVSCS